MTQISEVQLSSEVKKLSVLLYAPVMNLEKVLSAFSLLNDSFLIQGFSCQYHAHFGVVVHLYSERIPNDGQMLIESLAEKYHLEAMIIDQVPNFNEPGLLVMDMDSTVIQIECIDEIANYAGVGKEVSQVTELAMQGKLDFAQSLRQRVSCLKGVPDSVLQTVRDEIPLMPGISQLVETLKSRGWKIAIASGGFLYFAEYLAQRLGLDYALANDLEVDNGKLTGSVKGEIVDAQGKAECLKKLAEQYNISPQQTVAMGDGANDLVMMEAAGLGVAYHAKPVVRQQADIAIRYGGLDTLLLLTTSLDKQR